MFSDRAWGGRAARWAAAVALSVVTIVAVWSLSAGAAVVPGIGLAGCISRWNRAPLGHGRLYARTAAPRGLIVLFSDDVCGLAVSKRAAGRTDSALVYVQVLSGTYIWGEDPVTISSGVPSREITALAAEAGSRSNVRIDPRTNLVAPLGHAGLVKLAFPEATAAAKKRACPMIPDPPSYFQPPPLYDVLSRTASCAVTREIVWAYNDEEGKLLKPTSAGVRMIVGWRCTGAPSSTLPGNAPRTSGRITGTKRSEIIQVQAAPITAVSVADSLPSALG